ncbi:MAG: PhoH family protein [Acidimicrobiia bacterium]|nr:PhoH family protein [Acidimicrobiia bacterium]
MDKPTDVKTYSSKSIIDKDKTLREFLGHNDANVDIIEDNFDATLLIRSNEITVISSDKYVVKQVTKLIKELIGLIDGGTQITENDLRLNIDMIKRNESPSEAHGENVVKANKAIHPKTQGQRNYVEKIQSNTITFGVGPAGTGKSYLAVAMAVAALQSKSVQRIILTRPAVEAGEHFGFLPGDILAKIDPYLRPLYDALFDIVGTDAYNRFHERGIIEVAPLAFMRGRTLNDSFIVLDEAQNTSPEQMKMFLTRLGNNSKMVITGDLTQVDLPSQKISGLRIVRNILEGVDQVAFCDLTGLDVVRHRVVQNVVEAYDKWDKSHPHPYEN